MRIRVIPVFLVPAALLILTVLLAAQYFLRRRRFRTAGAVTDGTVIRVRSKKVRNSLYTFTAFVRYEADGQTFQTKFSPYPENTPDCAVKEGDTLTVRYPEGQPEKGFAACDLRYTMTAAVSAVFAAMVLFLTLLITDSLVRYPIGWFTLPERRLIAFVRLTGMGLIVLASVVLLLWELILMHRGVPVTAAVREVRTFGKQTLICAECETDGTFFPLRLVKSPSDKRGYSAGETVSLRRHPYDPTQFTIERRRTLPETVLTVFMAAMGIAGIVLFLIGEYRGIGKL